MPLPTGVRLVDPLRGDVEKTAWVVGSMQPDGSALQSSTTLIKVDQPPLSARRTRENATAENRFVTLHHVLSGAT